MRERCLVGWEESRSRTYAALGEAEAAAAVAERAIGLAGLAVGEAASLEVGHGLNGDGADAGDGHGDGEDGGDDLHFGVYRK